jgi:hypothetical protein
MIDRSRSDNFYVTTCTYMHSTLSMVIPLKSLSHILVLNRLKLSLKKIDMEFVKLKIYDFQRLKKNKKWLKRHF